MGKVSIMTTDNSKQNPTLDLLEPLPAIRKVSGQTTLPPLHEVLTEEDFTATLPTPVSSPRIPINISSRELPLPVPFQEHRSRVRNQPGIDLSSQRPKTRKRLPSGRPHPDNQQPRRMLTSPREPGQVGVAEISSKKRIIADPEEVTPSKIPRRSKRVRVDPCIDLSRDENKHVKPFFSPAKLAAQAILNSENGELSSTDIFEWMEANYAWIRYEPKQKNSWFYRVPAEMKRMSWIFAQVPGIFDTLWRIHPECREQLVVEAFKEGKLPPKEKLLGNPDTS